MDINLLWQLPVLAFLLCVALALGLSLIASVLLPYRRHGMEIPEFARRMNRRREAKKQQEARP